MDLNCRNITHINKNTDKCLFLNNLSVELFNTLSGLEGFLNLFNKKALSERDKELLIQAKYASFLLSHQIKALYYFQKVEKEAPQLHFIDLNLFEILSESLTFFEKERLSKNLDIIFSFDENIPNTLYGDSLKINELINCLIESIFLLAENKIEINVTNLKDEKNLKIVRFEFNFDSEIFANLLASNKFEKVVYENISFKSNIKKVDMNLAICNELLSQIDSKIIYDIKDNNFINMIFDLKLYSQNEN